MKSYHINFHDYKKTFYLLLPPEPTRVNPSLKKQNNHTSREATGFFPGHASFAYFFFFGSNTLIGLPCLSSSSSYNAGCTIISTSEEGVTDIMSTSGARLGTLRPSLDTILACDVSGSKCPEWSMCTLCRCGAPSCCMRRCTDSCACESAVLWWCSIRCF